MTSHKRRGDRLPPPLQVTRTRPESYQRLQDGDALLQRSRWAWLSKQLALSYHRLVCLSLGRRQSHQHVNVVNLIITAGVWHVERRSLLGCRLLTVMMLLWVGLYLHWYHHCCAAAGCSQIICQHKQSQHANINQLNGTKYRKQPKKPKTLTLTENYEKLWSISAAVNHFSVVFSI